MIIACLSSLTLFAVGGELPELQRERAEWGDTLVPLQHDYCLDYDYHYTMLVRFTAPYNLVPQ
jgi:hypothetical protein